MLVGVGKSEVYYSDGFIIVDEAVLKFEIAMDDSEFVDIFDSTDDLFEDFACFFFSHSFFADDVIKEFSIFHVLHDKEEMFWCLNDLVEVDDVGVSDEFEDMYFSGDSFYICYIDYFALF